MVPDLAIIVPAYKTRYLRRALESIARQTSPRARLYVFDDASPEAVEAIVRESLAGCGLPWEYVRFPGNLGGSALTDHYDRCIRATKEEWIWLFSDDDTMDPGCVEGFQRTLSETTGPCDIFAFDSVEIDGADRVISLHPPLARRESWKQHAYFFFGRSRFVPQQAVVFSRAGYERVGGFPRFPLAWASDVASMLALAAPGGIVAIPGPKIFFRSSGENISTSDTGDRPRLKLEASRQFVAWVHGRLAAVPDGQFPLTDAELRRLSLVWLKRQLVALHVWFSPGEAARLVAFLAETGGEPRAKAWLRVVGLNFAVVAHRLRTWLSPKTKF